MIDPADTTHPFSDCPLLVYTAHRHPGLDRAQFAIRWRQHGALGMAQPRWCNIARYIQGDAIPFDHPRADPACDGVAMVWYRSESHRLTHVADALAGPLLKRDELATFDRPVAQTAMLTDEDVRRDGSGRFILFAFRRTIAPTCFTPHLPVGIARHAIAVRRAGGVAASPYRMVEILSADGTDLLHEAARSFNRSPVDLVLTEAVTLHDVAVSTSAR